MKRDKQEVSVDNGDISFYRSRIEKKRGSTVKYWNNWINSSKKMKT